MHNGAHQFLVLNKIPDRNIDFDLLYNPDPEENLRLGDNSFYDDFGLVPNGTFMCFDGKCKFVAARSFFCSDTIFGRPSVFKIYCEQLHHRPGWMDSCLIM